MENRVATPGTTETEEVEYVGREIDYQGCGKRTSTHDEEDDEIEYLGYSIPGLLKAGEYWVRAASGGWERWDVPEVSNRLNIARDASNIHQPSEEELVNPPRLYFGRNHVPEASRARKERMARSDKREPRGSDRDDEDGDKHKHGYGHGMRTASERRSQSASETGPIYYFPPQEVDTPATTASGDRRPTDAEVLARLPPGSKIGPPRGVRRTHNASTSARISTKPLHATAHTRSLEPSITEGTRPHALAKKGGTGTDGNQRLSNAEILARLPPGAKLGPPRGVRHASNPSTSTDATTGLPFTSTPPASPSSSSASVEELLTGAYARPTRDAGRTSPTISTSSCMQPNASIGATPTTQRIVERSSQEPRREQDKVSAGATTASL